MLRYFSLISLLTLFWGTVWAQELQDDSFAEPLILLYSGALDGELEPCGCSELGDLGGLRRRAALIADQRRDNPELLLISSGGLLSAEGVADPIKAEFLLTGMELMKYDAIGLRQRDLLYGKELIAESSLLWVLSQKQQSLANALFQRKRMWGEHEVTIFSWPSAGLSMQGFDLKETLAELNGALQRSQQGGKMTILLSQTPLKEVEAGMDLDYIDILLIKPSYERYGKPFIQGRTLILQPGSRGMYMGQVELHLNKQGEIADFRHQEIPMPPREDLPEVIETWYGDYNRAVEKDYRRRVVVRKQMEAGESPYLGSAGCLLCHSNAVKIYQNSKHATAFSTLKRVNKAFDPDCLRCHVVASLQSGGFLDEYITPQLKGVQCESCHGGSRKHAAEPSQFRTLYAEQEPFSVCSGCHNGQHSPEFNQQTYWSAIAH